mmetsp:Transcript_12174/g.12186  ORF Transcript_12174/g.12186 Transcript_12174/m.12186 type:complete len:115 (-) Transcript_12174:210-554(-)
MSHFLENNAGRRPSTHTKTLENIECLKKFKCSFEKRKNEKGGITTVYICKHHNCNKEFSRTWSILDHCRMHEGVKPYNCKVCGRAYTQKGNMIKHMKRHSQPAVEQRKNFGCNL